MEALDLPLGYKNATIATNLVNEAYMKFRPKELNDTEVDVLPGSWPGDITYEKTRKKP